jgi:hypothetical protein
VRDRLFLKSGGVIAEPPENSIPTLVVGANAAHGIRRTNE